MCSTVFTEKAQCLNRTSITPLLVEYLNDPSMPESMKKWELHLASVLKERVKGLKEGKDPGQMDLDWDATPDTVPYHPLTADDMEYDPVLLKTKGSWVDLKEADEMTESEQIDLDLNKYISAKVRFHKEATTKPMAR
jgi:hypothetical protein